MEGDDLNETEPLSTKDKAIILGLEEIIEELKSTNELMKFNNDNITNFREEMDSLREEIQDNSQIMSRSIGSPSMQMNNTVIAHLASIRTMIFWALFGLPIIVVILTVVSSNA